MEDALMRQLRSLTGGCCPPRAVADLGLLPRRRPAWHHPAGAVPPARVLPFSLAVGCGLRGHRRAAFA